MHDLLVIGAGPGGLSAALVATGNGLDVRVLEATPDVGGQLRRADHPVADVLGQPAQNGLELVRRFETHAKTANVQVLHGHAVERVERTTGAFEVTTRNHATLAARLVVLATGTRARALGLPGVEDEHQPARTAKPEWVGQRVVIVGGGDEAVSTAVELARQGVDITIVARAQLRARPQFTDDLPHEPRIEVRTGDRVTQVEGTRVHLASGATLDAVQVLARVGVEIVLPALIPAPDRHPDGRVVVDADHQTSVPGLFAIGDCTVEGPARYASIAIAHGTAVARRAEALLRPKT